MRLSSLLAVVHLYESWLCAHLSRPIGCGCIVATPIVITPRNAVAMGAYLIPPNFQSFPATPISPRDSHPETTALLGLRDAADSGIS